MTLDTSAPAGGAAAATAARPTTLPRPNRAAATPSHPVPAADNSGLVIAGLSKVLAGRTIVESFDLNIERGELVTLLGPSGCGKTTTLRMIAGFLAPDQGTIAIDGRDVTQLGPDKRPSAMVFQNYALWPHLSVFKNVAFPLTLRRLPRAEVKARVMAALELVNLSHHAHSRPAHISGGEQQRAALARAIVQEPDVLLLDEPLSNLDAKLRVRVREEIREIQQRLGITTVMVTHDQEEALAVSDRVAVMNRGRIEQVSAPAELYARPRTRFVASFIGSMNFLAGPDLAAARLAGIGASGAAAAGAAAAGGTAAGAAAAGSAGAGGTASRNQEAGSSGTDQQPDDGEIWAVRPEDVLYSPDCATASPGALSAEIRRVHPHGHFSELIVDVDGITLRSLVTGAAPQPGDRGTVTLRNVRHYRDGLLVDGAAG